MLSLKERV